MTNPTTEEMASIVYEFYTGKCWHGTPILDDARAPTKAQCPKCGDSMGYAVKDLNNPPLSTSIDAWHEHIFPVMSGKQLSDYPSYLREATKNLQDKFTATAMNHLQAAYAVVKGEK